MFRGEELTSLKAHILLEATPEGKIEETMQIVVHSEEHNLHSMGRHCKIGCKNNIFPYKNGKESNYGIPHGFEACTKRRQKK